ncbi:MAG TPA: VanZ family protein [Vicinamibacterales bacterium]|nr:VanZ family protein [Vicinamibacterales bacterium]
MSRARAVALWGPVAAYMAVIFVLSAQTQPPLPSQVSDKQGHSLGYMGLAVTVARGLAGGIAAGVPLRIAASASAIAAGYGATDEWHQSFVPGRSADIYDWYADAIGALLGGGACWAWGIIRSRADV